MRELLIFDGDDTLWLTEPLYDSARRQAAAIVRSAGFDAADWDARERVIDVANVARFGMSAQRFPTSCVEALEALAHAEGKAIDDELRHAVWDAGSTVFESVAPLVDGVEQVLSELSRDYRLALLTKGDDEVQRKRVGDSGLARYFELISIVPSKDVCAFDAVRRALDVPPGCTWSIGNSLASDVLPALDAGMRAVWVDAHVWEYERHVGAVPASVYIADRLSMVPDIIRREPVSNRPEGTAER